MAADVARLPVRRLRRPYADEPSPDPSTAAEHAVPQCAEGARTARPQRAVDAALEVHEGRDERGAARTPDTCGRSCTVSVQTALPTASPGGEQAPSTQCTHEAHGTPRWTRSTDTRGATPDALFRRTRHVQQCDVRHAEGTQGSASGGAGRPSKAGARTGWNCVAEWSATRARRDGRIPAGRSAWKQASRTGRQGQRGRGSNRWRGWGLGPQHVPREGEKSQDRAAA